MDKTLKNFIMNNFIKYLIKFLIAVLSVFFVCCADSSIEDDSVYDVTIKAIKADKGTVLANATVLIEAYNSDYIKTTDSDGVAEFFSVNTNWYKVHIHITDNGNNMPSGYYSEVFENIDFSDKTYWQFEVHNNK